MKNLLYELFGFGYSWPMSYRWHRIKELFNFLPSYYELTIIPSIVLGCLTNLGWYGIHFATLGIVYVTPIEFVFAFLLFIIPMTIEDLVKVFIEHVKSKTFFL